MMEITLINGYFKHFTLECPPQTTQLHRGWFSLFFWWKLLSLLRVDGWLLWHRVIAFPRIESLKEGLMNCWIFLLFSPHSKFSGFSLPNSLVLSVLAGVQSEQLSLKHFLKAPSQYLSAAPYEILTAPHTVPHWAPASVFSAGVYQHASWCSHLLPSPGNAKPHWFLLCSSCFLPSHKGVLKWRNSHIQNSSPLEGRHTSILSDEQQQQK